MIVRTFIMMVMAAVLLVAPAAAQQAAFTTKARNAILIDLSTDTVLLEKGADARIPTASMSKVMTAYVIFDALKQKRITLNDRFEVSTKAWRKGGSSTFLEPGQLVRVEDLLRGMIIQSGNDASITLAEGLAGTEDSFVLLMNRTAERIGLTASNFANSTGWPDPNHYSTVRDLALLAQRLVVDFPEYYGYYAERNFTFNNIRQANRNPLLFRGGLNADGLKTGHTSEAGYGLIASAVEGDRRLVMVVAGLDSVQDRSTESVALMTWGFRNFTITRMARAGDVIGDLPVWLGTRDTVPVAVETDIVLTRSVLDATDTLEAVIEALTPLHAPVDQGFEAGTLVIRKPDGRTARYPLKAVQRVPKTDTLSIVARRFLHVLQN